MEPLRPCWFASSSRSSGREVDEAARATCRSPKIRARRWIDSTCAWVMPEHFLEQLEVLELDLVVADLDDVVGADAAAQRGLGVEREDGDPAREELLEPLDAVARALEGALVAVLVVHVEDEVDGDVLRARCR